MITNLPVIITLLFFAATFATLLLFYRIVVASCAKTARFMTLLLAWMAVQAIVSCNGFYHTNTAGFPPRFALLLMPPVLLIAILFLTATGRKFIDSLPLVSITYLNVVRIPVEITLYLLFLNKAVPELMTFEGRNLDILAGLTAPFIAYYGLKKERLPKNVILLWNFLCLGLLINIVIIAVLSAPLAFQKLAFDQPNIALLYFPFTWLPSFIVPVVLFGHLVSVRQLLKAKV